MELEVLDIEGKKTGEKCLLPDSVFGIDPNHHTVYLDVKRFLANQRQGTHKTKERGEIVGSTRKIKKQKGTGTARAGSIKSPIFVGGGRIFGPRPKKYTMKLNKNVKRLARRSALSIKAKEQNILVVRDFDMDVPKTKDFVQILKALGLENKKSIFLSENRNNNIYLASRNLRKALTVSFSELTTYDIVNANKLIFLESSLKKIEEKLG